MATVTDKKEGFERRREV